LNSNHPNCLSISA